MDWDVYNKLTNEQQATLITDVQAEEITQVIWDSKEKLQGLMGLH